MNREWKHSTEMPPQKEYIIKIVPPEWDDDDLEDLLATDSLFIEYFNSYLALPSFPEPLQFNKETGGFEVLNNARKHLASEIKAAVRATRRRKRIYRPVHSHSYSAIPLIPMEDPPEAEEMEIDTTFTVKSLNREQGIEWIKRERMPAFLESDCYMEYRLGKLVSQSENAYKGEHFLSVKIDYAPTQRKEKIEIIEEPKEDETDVLMRNMYVCLGNTSTKDTDTWVTQAKSALHTQTTDSNIHPLSAVPGILRSGATLSRPSTGRPVSALSSQSARSRRIKSAVSERDSGIWSPLKSSTLGSNEYINSTESEGGEHCVTFEDDTPIQSRLFHPDNKPIAPRPSDLVCVMAGEENSIDKGKIVYNTPRLPTPPPTENLDNESEGYCSNNNGPLEEGSDDGEIYEGEPIMFETIEELGSLIVATALKYAMSTVCGVSIKQMEMDHNLINLFPHKKYVKFTKEDIANTEFLLGSKSQARRLHREHLKQEVVHVTKDESETTASESSSLIALGKDENDSDEDSLLNSDEDYEEGRDDFFHKKHDKPLSLSTRKGLQKFRAFLKGTLGEKNWNLWLDIERAKSIKDPDEKTNYLLAMRERYLKHGGTNELSREMKVELDLNIPSHWTLDKLSSVQTYIAEPLVLYWAPRFLIKQQVHINPDRHYIYHHLKLIRPTESSYPNPPVIPLLPLRPKTCMPRVRQAKDMQIKDLFSEQTYVDAVAATKPPVGNKRTYDLPDMFAPFNQKKEKESENKERKKANCVKTPRQLISSKMSPKRPPSAPPSMKSTRHSLRDMWGSSRSLDSVSLMRPSSANSQQSSVSEASDLSEFIGGKRMEGLLQALASEKPSGSFFRKHIEKSHNKLWKNCLTFWHGLQTYHRIFYSEKLDPFVLENRAKFLYSQFVVTCAPCSIQCESSIQDLVHDKINPPYEELFDPVEEYILTVLFDAWTHSLSEDITTFQKVELQDVKRHLDTRSRYVVALQKRGIIKERVETPENSMDGYQDPVYDEALWDDIPPEFRNFGLEKLVHNRIELEHFRQFLAENYASMDLMCWMDIEAFRRIPPAEEKRRDLKAKDVKVKYFNKKYFFGPNSPAGKEGQEKIMAAGGGWGKLLSDRPPTNCLTEAQKYVRERLEKKWLPLFLATESFYDRQRPHSGMGDVVEDVMIQKKKKSQAIWKMLESKWVSSSKDILTFRKALNNPVTSFHFRRFLSAKFHGEHFFENDVLFWQEVQCYKDLCHVHSDRALVQQKTAAITNCFIDSPIPPSLQVDITQDMADKILDRKLEATPYLFREAQLTVFRVLFTKWQEFCQFRSHITEDKMLPTLERLRKKNVVAEKKRLKEMEEKQERELRRRQELGLPIEGIEDDTADDGYSDVLKSTGGASDDGTIENMDGKDNVTWSYSQYVQALDKEDVLNNVDEMTFSSLTLNSQCVADTFIDDESQSCDKASVVPSVSQKTNSDVKKQKKDVKASSKVETDDINSIKTSKPLVDTSETGSQTESKPKKVPQHVSSPTQDQNRPSKSNGRISPPETKKELTLVMTQSPPVTAPVSNKASPTTPSTTQPRLQRKIPPLVQRQS